MQRGDCYVLLPAVIGDFPWQHCDKRGKKRKEDAMPKKVTLEMKIAKREKYKEKIEKNRAEIQPTIDAYNALDAEIKADLARLEQEKRNTVYDHVMSVFGEDISPEEFIKKFDRIMNDNRNKSFIRQLKEDQSEREKLKESSSEIKKSPVASGENVTELSEQKNEDSPASDKAAS